LRQTLHVFVYLDEFCGFESVRYKAFKIVGMRVIIVSFNDMRVIVVSFYDMRVIFVSIM